MDPSKWIVHLNESITNQKETRKVKSDGSIKNNCSFEDTAFNEGHFFSLSLYYLPESPPPGSAFVCFWHPFLIVVVEVAEAPSPSHHLF